MCVIAYEALVDGINMSVIALVTSTQ